MSRFMYVHALLGLSLPLSVQMVNASASSLIGAIDADDTEALRLASSAVADINAVSEDGETALYRAVLRNRPVAVEYLLSLPGIEVNKPNNHGVTPLIVASVFGHTECMRLLLAADGVDVNAADERGNTALHYAAEFRQGDAMALLLETQGIKADIPNKEGITPLYMAVSYNNTDEAATLVAAGADVDAKIITGESAVTYCACKGNVECLELLLKAGAAVNTSSDHCHPIEAR